MRLAFGEVLTMLSGILYGLNIIVWLAFAWLLGILCFRTRSKGLILISAVLLTGGIFDWAFEQVSQLYVDRSMASKMSDEGTQDMRVGELLLTLSLIQHLLYNCLCLLGGLFIFREWRQGRFRQPQPEHIEEPEV